MKYYKVSLSSENYHTVIKDEKGKVDPRGNIHIWYIQTEEPAEIQDLQNIVDRHVGEPSKFKVKDSKELETFGNGILSKGGSYFTRTFLREKLSE